MRYLGIILLLSISFLYKSYSTELKVGAAYNNISLTKGYDSKYGSQFGGIVGLEKQISESPFMSFEIAYYGYSWKVIDSDNVSNSGDFEVVFRSGFYYIINYFFFEKDALINPKIHFGALSIPLFSWNLGGGIDFRISEDFKIDLSYNWMRDLMSIWGDEDIVPDFLFLTLKYDL